MSLAPLPLAGCECGATGSGATHSNAESEASRAAAPPSCSGLEARCGTAGENCCKTLAVPGGTFARDYDGVDFMNADHPATVGDFYLDKYEVTVGRLRAFIDAGGGVRGGAPDAGSGAHPKIPGSGWQASWNASLAETAAELTIDLKCHDAYQSWTDVAAGDESKPVNCLDWYTAFAFCAWDGGRLPTEAEWNYAAAGGGEQRYYPWSVPANSTTIDDSYAVY